MKCECGGTAAITPTFGQWVAICRDCLRTTAPWPLAEMAREAWEKGYAE
jgi:hypothetical protein